VPKLVRGQARFADRRCGLVEPRSARIPVAQRCAGGRGEHEIVAVFSCDLGSKVIDEEAGDRH